MYIINKNYISANIKNMNNDIEEIASVIGADIIRNGGEISRCEDSIKRMLTAKNRQKIDVFCISSLVIVSTENKTVITRITDSDLDLNGIINANAASRSICYGKEHKKDDTGYTRLTKALATILAVGSFCLYFGGNAWDFVFAGIISLIISNINIKLNIFAKTFLQSVVAGMLAFIPRLIGINTNPDKIMIGTIMLLIPGITIGTAIRDIMYSDTISGITELTESIFIALAIVLGYGVGVIVYGI